MAEQEEEMRQNMEELKATQEESKRREQEFRGMADAIGHSLMMVEYDMQGIISNVNEKVCIFMGRGQDEISGKQHQEVFEGSLNTEVLFWEELKNNKQLIRTEKIKIGRKEHILKEHFSTVLNPEKNVVQYINFIADLTI